MKPSFVARKRLQQLMIIASSCLALTGQAQANGPGSGDLAAIATEIPAAISARSDAGPPTDGLADLKFREFFRMPIGPRGLEPSEKLAALVGKKVRIVGFMARQETPIQDVFIFSPIPVTLGDEDESLADDLPASVIFVHAADAKGRTIPFFPGLLRLTGTLSLGPHEEADGHGSTVRLQLDPELATLMLASQQQK